MPCSNANDWGREIHFYSLLSAPCNSVCYRQHLMSLKEKRPVSYILYDVAECVKPCFQASKQQIYTYMCSTDSFSLSLSPFQSSVVVIFCLPVSAFTQHCCSINNSENDNDEGQTGLKLVTFITTTSDFAMSSIIKT